MKRVRPGRGKLAILATLVVAAVGLAAVALAVSNPVPRELFRSGRFR